MSISSKLKKVLATPPVEKLRLNDMQSAMRAALGDKWDPKASYSLIPEYKQESKYTGQSPIAVIELPGVRSVERFRVYRKE